MLMNFSVIKKIVDRYDIMDLLSTGAPADEYDFESEMIAKHIDMDMSAEEVSEIVKNIFDNSFNESTDISICMNIASDILMSMHDIAEEYLFEEKSLKALCWLIERGRELEFSINGKTYFISCDKSAKYVSLWDKDKEQSFESLNELIEKAVIDDKPFLFVWKNMDIETLF